MPVRPDPALVRALGVRIRDLRRARRLTQEALGESAGLQPETVSRVETGSGSPDLATLVALASGLSVSLSDLVDVDAAVPTATVAPDDIPLWTAISNCNTEQRAALLALIQSFR
jgi:transcriptional regulator with XRE-family HTH domain